MVIVRTLLALVIFICAPCTVAFATPLAWWRFEEYGGQVAGDYTGNGHAGTLFKTGVDYAFFKPVGPCGEAAFVLADGRAYFDENSLEFDQHNQGAVVVADSPTLRPAQAITIEAWVFVQTGVSPNMSIVSKPILDRKAWCQTCPNSFQISVFGDSLHFALYNLRTKAAEVHAGLLARDRWVHVAGTWDTKSGLMRVFMNHEPKGQRPFAGPISYDGSPTIIGADADEGAGTPDTQWTQGLIDELRISDVALSPDEMLRCVSAGERQPGRAKSK